MKKLIPTLFCLLCTWLPFSAKAQILINEVSAAGDTAYLDEDGKVNDWIELYNAGNTTVNLAGYQLVCSQNNNAYTWTFPEVYMDPQQRLTVFCSGKDRNWYFNHWEVPVFYDMPWRYFVGTSEPPANWAEPNFNDASWNVGLGGFGYGDGDDSTIIPPTTSLYMRISFQVLDTSNILIAALLGDYDDGYVAYLNNVEIGRLNIGVQGVHPAHDEYAYDEHEALLYQYGAYSHFVVAEPETIDEALIPGTNTLSIQVHNAANGMDDMSAIPILLLGVIDTSITYFPFAADVELHTNFKLNSHGCLLLLKDANGATIDQQVIGEMQMNHSRGRMPDGGNFSCVFTTPTPDSSNNLSACFSGYGPSPTWSLASGFYTNTQTTTATANGNGTIRWTNTGADPDLTAPIYAGAVNTTTTQVLRARFYPNDPLVLPGPDATVSYFMNENITLPVVSLVTDPDNLFDPNYGIYVLGNTADTTFNDIPFPTANFWQGWRRPAAVTFFDKQNQQGFQTDASISIQGNWSKMFPQRGFYVDADEDFGGDPVNYKLFPDKPATSYYGFNIRNMGTDWNGAMMRDRCIQKMAQPATYLDVMDGFPCVLFINGVYWGVYEIREKQDKHFIKNNSEVDDDNVDFLQFDGDIIEGDNQDFLNMALFIGNSDMTITTHYDSAMRMIDRENFCDYFITETYIANTDWLGQYTNNIKYWRMQTPEGKWRYMLWDTDLSWGANGPVNADMLDNAIHPAVNNPHSDMLRSLLANETFKNYFINRYADLMNTAYLPVNIEKTVRKIEAEMAPEMDRNFDLWGNANSSFAPLILQWPCDTMIWGQNVDDMLLFTQWRLPYARTFVQTQFNLVKQVDLTLDVFPAGAGTIKLNTIVPDSLPWSGVYYDGAPVTMTVQPAPGFRFLYWRANNVMAADNSNPSLTININDSTTFTAVFEVIELNLSAYPNPFYDALTVSYALPNQAQVSMRIYNTLGQVIAEPLSPTMFQPAGVHSLTINPDAYGMMGGVYFIELITGDYRKVISVIAGRPKP